MTPWLRVIFALVWVHTVESSKCGDPIRTCPGFQVYQVPADTSAPPPETHGHKYSGTLIDNFDPFKNESSEFVITAASCFPQCQDTKITEINETELTEYEVWAGKHDLKNYEEGNKQIK